MPAGFWPGWSSTTEGVLEPIERTVRREQGEVPETYPFAV